MARDPSELSEMKCVACEGGTPPLTRESGEKLLGELSAHAPVSWQISPDAKKISAEFVFKNFKEAVSFVDKVAEIAEEEQHHPDIKIFAYKKVLIEISTHAIGGLSQNDFILAAKINKLV